MKWTLLNFPRGEEILAYGSVGCAVVTLHGDEWRTRDGAKFSKDAFTHWTRIPPYDHLPLPPDALGSGCNNP